MRKPFHGSYAPDDVTFLLKPVKMAATATEEKERAIQSGQRHYSEMLAVEKSPDERYMQLFFRALADNKEKFARHLASLARTLAQRPGNEVVLVSLARAGTPVGVLLHRALKALGRKSFHYSVSIIRDRGIDTVALDYILNTMGHSDKDVVFVDGWTGKGAISTELHSTVSAYNNMRGTALDTTLVAVCDLAGTAGVAATADDYLIPSAILNAIISGLISRSVLNAEHVGPGDFHACVFYEEKHEEDLSRFFVDLLTPLILKALANPDESPICLWGDSQRTELKRLSDQFVAAAMDRYGVTDRNYVKPGIGESTRALLRRVPERLILADPQADDVRHLVTLANTNAVPIEYDPTLPYRAAVIIKTLD